MAAKGRRTRTRTPKKDWRPAFLKAFAETGLVVEAAKKAKVGRTTVYEERQRNETFALKWAEIEEWTTEEMEQEARRRAVLGVEEPVYYKGELNGHIRKFSDVLLIFLLKSRKPETYRENVKVEHGGTITHEVTEKVDGEIDQIMAELGLEREAQTADSAS
jgi:hypothetical protein